MSRVFICYRHQTAAAFAHLIFEKLQSEFGEDNVFMDPDIPPGQSYRLVIQRTIDRCDVMIVLIDRDWVQVADNDGTRKLDKPDDMLRNEIEQGLQRGIVVLPVLLENAEVPDAGGLPESIRELVDFNAARVRTGRSFKHHMEELIQVVRSAPQEVAGARETVRRFLQMWDNGDWVAAHRILESALAEDQPILGRPLAVLNARRETVAKLADAVAAFERAAFDAALELLDEIPAEEGPPNLEAAREIARLGSRLAPMAVGAADTEEVASLTAAVERVIKDSEGAILPGRREIEELLGKVRRDADYQAALVLHQDGRFAEAREAFRRLGSYRDAPSKVAVCGLWLGFFALLREQDWSGARSKLREIRELEPSAPTQKWLWWCNLIRRLVPALERMAAGTSVRDANVPWPGGGCPYRVLDRPPQLTIEQFNELSYELQGRSGGMSADVRQAWDAVRKAESRLLVDFSLYPVADPERAGRLVESIREVGDGIDPEATFVASLPPVENGSQPIPLLERLGAVLAEDRGVLLALMLNYEEAIEVFLDVVRARPGDPQALHSLGLAAAARIYLHGASEAPAETWEHLVVGSGAVFGDDRFWRRWWAGRRRVYRSSSDQIETARHELERFWVDEVRSSGGSHPDLEVAFRTEIEGARAVNAGGGAPIPGRPTAEPIVVGPLGARKLGLTEAIAEWAAQFPDDVLEQPSWQRRVALYFSELAEATVLFEDGQYAQALEAVVRVRPVPAADFALSNPGFASAPQGRARFRRSLGELQQQAHSRLALEAVSGMPVDVDRAMEHWRQAVVKAGRARRDGLVAEIGQVAVGRAAALQKDRGDDEQLLAGLNDAVKLLQYVIDAGWDRDNGVRDALIDSLLHRAIHLSNKYDRESDARLDAQRAWCLSPDSLKAIAVLCGASLHDARDRLMHGRRDLAEALLKEVEEHLAAGFARYPESRELEQCRDNLDNLRGMLDLEAPRLAQQKLEGLRQATSTVVDDRDRDRLIEAMLAEVRQEYARAVELYAELVEEEPDDQSLRGKMAWCYRLWIQHLRGGGGDPAEIRRISEEARARCPGFDVLRDVAPALESAED
jgi:tetratricopeptide (TPR) repeat protein